VLALLERRRLVWAVAGLLIGLTVAAQIAMVPTPDTAFLLYAAGRLLDGARLYRDLVEINPPLIIWLNLPVAWLARRLHVSDFALYSLATALVVGALLLFTRRLARRYALDDAPGLRRYVLLLLCVALFPFAGLDFGEREHLVVALLLPYVFLTVAWLRGQRVPGLEAAVTGCLGGLAVALKPHFGLVWLALEVLRRWRIPSERWKVGPAAAAAVAVLAGYVLVVLRVTPEYLPLVGLLGPAYTQFLKDPFFHLLILAPRGALVLFVLLALAALRRRIESDAFVTVFAVAMVACYLAGAAQEKGFPYHFFPALVLAVVLLGLLARLRARADWRLSERLYARLPGPLAAAIGLVAVGSTLVTLAGGGPKERRERKEMLELAAIVRDHAAGRPVGVLSWHLASAFPLLNYAGVTLATRLPHLWILPASYWDSLRAEGPLRYHRVDQMQPAERWMYNGVREDLLSVQPNVLVVLRPARDVRQNGLRRLHYIRYFERDPGLAAFFSRYEFLAEKGEFDLYQRIEHGRPRTAPPPADEPGTLDVRQGEWGYIRVVLLDPEFAAGVALFGAFVAASGLADRRRPGSPPEASPARRSHMSRV